MMKKTIAISFFTLATALNAQIKVFSGGLQSYGSTTAPTGSVKHRFSGDVVIGSSASSTESAYIRGNNTTSAAGSPDYTWLSNSNTGLFHPGSNLIGFTVNGGEKFRMNASGQLLNTNSTSSASAPDYSWNSDVGTGIFHPTSNTIGFSINGNEKLRISSSGQIIFNTSSNSWVPDIAWTSDVSTGIFHPAASNVALTIAGTEAFRVNSSKNLLIGGTNDINTRLVVSGASNSAVIVGISSHTSDNQYCQANYVNRSGAKVYGGFCNSTGSDVEVFFVKGNGDVWSKTNYYYSDYNLKENIDSLENSLNKIKQLKGVKYNFKASFVGNAPSVTELGLLAQDVEQILPEVVSTNDNGIKGIAYQNLIPVLIEAIKELDAKNAKLENDLNTCCSKPKDDNANRNTQNGYDSSINEDTKSYMKQNKPNPFNKETVIEYNILETGSASILVFDMNGKLLKTIVVKIPGKGSATISASDFKAGMYYYSLIVNDKEIDTKKMILTE
jgi:hypothetical protein